MLGAASADDKEEVLVRTASADTLCEHFGFRDALGHLQRSTCLKALRDLESAEEFQLPAVA